MQVYSGVENPHFLGRIRFQHLLYFVTHPDAGVAGQDLYYYEYSKITLVTFYVYLDSTTIHIVANLDLAAVVDMFPSIILWWIQIRPKKCEFRATLIYIGSTYHLSVFVAYNVKDIKYLFKVSKNEMNMFILTSGTVFVWQTTCIPFKFYIDL